MSQTQVSAGTPTGLTEFNDTAIGNTADAIKSGSARLYSVIIDNSLNGSAVYVKLFNLASGSVVVGTTAPDEVIYVPASSVITQNYFTAAAAGKVFGTALSAICVTTGGTAGSSAPASNVNFTAQYV